VRKIEQKSMLLNNIDRNDTLKIIPLETKKNSLIITDDFQIKYDNKAIFEKITFEIKNGDRIAIVDKNGINEGNFKVMLSKMGFSTIDFEKDIQGMSEGQKKKVLLAKSVSEQANIYIWDEPLNYIDILTRIQIEEVLLKYHPTLVFVEHDEIFIGNVATKILKLKELN